MRTSAGFLRPSPARLLLLGLLGLLLWGQCAFHIIEGGSGGKAPPNLHLQTAVRVASLDSFSSHGPDLLYLTIGLRNQSRAPLQVVSLDGGLAVGKQGLGFILRPVGRGVVVPGGAERLFAAVVQPYRGDDTHPGTSFAALRAAGQAGQQARQRGRLTVFYSYQPYPGTADQANFRSRAVPLAR